MSCIAHYVHVIRRHRDGAPPSHLATVLQVLLLAVQPDRGNARISLPSEALPMFRRLSQRQETRILIPPEPGFYVMRLARGGPWCRG